MSGSSSFDFQSMEFSTSTITPTLHQSHTTEYNMLTGLQHVNLTVGRSDWKDQDPLELADKLYGEVIGLKQDDVPSDMIGKLRWFALGISGQQIHISLEYVSSKDTFEIRSSGRQHPCFVLPYTDLAVLADRLDEFATSGHPAACSAVTRDQSPMLATPEGESREQVVFGSRKGDRFFIRDFAGNRLEFAGI
ncbi:hypothetical protein [Phaffia rhodozyma]|uniref:VOC domain-containing protein n=1 Tax=Phaffia rhodozyma TaxID=264483 RepID=A0A0F7SXY0_PHARH|nr:hypothetical protein [Phaffia rhodozyma]